MSSAVFHATIVSKVDIVAQVSELNLHGRPRQLICHAIVFQKGHTVLSLAMLEHYWALSTQLCALLLIPDMEQGQLVTVTRGHIDRLPLMIRVRCGHQLIES